MTKAEKAGIEACLEDIRLDAENLRDEHEPGSAVYNFWSKYAAKVEDEIKIVHDTIKTDK